MRSYDFFSLTLTAAHCPNSDCNLATTISVSSYPMNALTLNALDQRTCSPLLASLIISPELTLRRYHPRSLLPAFCHGKSPHTTSLFACPHLLTRIADEAPGKPKVTNIDRRRHSKFFLESDSADLRCCDVKMSQDKGSRTLGEFSSCSMEIKPFC